MFVMLALFNGAMREKSLFERGSVAVGSAVVHVQLNLLLGEQVVSLCV